VRTVLAAQVANVKPADVMNVADSYLSAAPSWTPQMYVGSQR